MSTNFRRLTVVAPLAPPSPKLLVIGDDTTHALLVRCLCRRRNRRAFLRSRITCCLRLHHSSNVSISRSSLGVSSLAAPPTLALRARPPPPLLLLVGDVGRDCTVGEYGGDSSPLLADTSVVECARRNCTPSRKLTPNPPNAPKQLNDVSDDSTARSSSSGEPSAQATTDPALVSSLLPVVSVMSCIGPGVADTPNRLNEVGLIKFRANMNESASSTTNVDGLSAAWLNTETFLPTSRVLFDGDTAELRRDSVPVLPFSANSADAFDLAVTTVYLLERMYTALTRLWADSWPLLEHRVSMVNLQTQYRAFHRYATDAIHQHLVQPLLRSDSAQTVGSQRGVAVSTRTIRSLQETLRRDREQEQHYQALANSLETELRVLEQQTDELRRELSGRNEAGKYQYLERLAEAKEARANVLAVLVGELNLTRVPSTYNRMFEERLLNTLNESIATVAALRSAVDVAPTLFRGMSPRGQLQIVLPRMSNANLPDALLGLYQELYLSLNEASVRNLLERQFGSGGVVNGSRVPP